LIVTVNEPTPSTIIPVPLTALPFCASIVKWIPGLGEGGLAVVPPPHPARARTPANTRRVRTRNRAAGLVTFLSYVVAPPTSPCPDRVDSPCKGMAVLAFG